MTGQGLELGKGFIQQDSFIFKNIKQKKMETEHQKKDSVDTTASLVPWVKGVWVKIYSAY